VKKTEAVFDYAITAGMAKQAAQKRRPWKGHGFSRAALIILLCGLSDLSKLGFLEDEESLMAAGETAGPSTALPRISR
jgi:hypothetical protein